ncbi:V-type ATP synthase subunit I [Halolactibacillus alkaliphilus]|uniref:V-type ATP synthase subunit I n=1 Tax=Halolactibacillus alkaliphilus TaxID=442899 RepID=A0A511WZV8_9BACI|nr:V-type ATP synthase subunit I [Halolactibacillus alkaliphilus]GEN56232.1 V-type ATP synthase subunit I [Halolactibacillus alkaliphilus]GGN66470.1 V-type ATP synthase subunit I [Halolactibacillus alkaliphilus]SFO67671.1 V/A-type H+-transporting ATPase subunit I [Halolactibacillus alkaliphilus]
MAIAKMKKLTLISFHEQKDRLLQSIQALQRFEVVDLPSSDLGDVNVSPYEVDTLETVVKKFETRIDQVQTALGFIQPYIPKRPLKERLQEKRREYTLEELEQEIFTFSPKTLVKDVLDLEKRLDTIAELKKELNDKESFFKHWKKLDVSAHDLRSMERVTGSVGVIPQHDQNTYMTMLEASDLLYVNEVYQTRDEIGVVVYFDRRDQEAIKPLLNDAHFEHVTEKLTEKPHLALEDIDEELKALKKETASIKDRLAKMSKEVWQLMLTEEYYEAKLQRERSKLFLIDEKHLFIMEGWLEEEEVPQMELALKSVLPEAEYVLYVNDVKEEEIDNVPVVLKNNDYVSPFESITAMYNLPKYNEIDPTPFLAPFYLLFFGMMAADVGYGLLLWLATFAVLKFTEVSPAMKKNMRFFHLLSYPTIIWGLIYGSFFGAALPVVLLSTTNDVITILILSVIFGITQIFFGLGINTYLKLRNKDKFGAFSDGIGWIGIFIGLIVMLLGNMLLDSEILGTIGAIIAVASALGIILATTLGSENKALGVGLGVYNLYGITGYIGDIVSYTRLMALGVSSGSIALAFNMIIGFIPGVGRFTVGAVLFIVLHAVNLGLTFLSSYVHGARLIFVEFFGKFYEGGGKALNPLRAAEKHIQLKNQKQS